MKRIVKRTIMFLYLGLALKVNAQKDTSIISFHFQQTLVSQYHPKFHAPYTGENSLVSDEKAATSLTNTLFFAVRPWKNGLLIVNPEIAGGEGLSGATGVAGFPNGEIFRVGNPKPTLYLARLVYEHIFPSRKPVYEYEADEPNNVRGLFAVDYTKVFGGRFCLADYFDGNPYSHDPRSQFLNWTYMSAGAWDYAADTRGYTWGFGVKWKRKNWMATWAETLVPKVANALEMDLNISKAFASQAEVTHLHSIKGRPGQLQATLFYNKAHMGNYIEALKNGIYPPDVTSTANYKNHKWGWVLSGAQQIGNDWGGFARISWNDGKNETWAFTEVDRSVNIGVQRSKDNSPDANTLGLGVVVNGISKNHRAYLAEGGYGFIIGDGQLNYGPESIAELYYRFNFFGNHLQVSPDYQFVMHPAYNKDRGPVHVFAIRAHIEL